MIRNDTGTGNKLGRMARVTMLAAVGAVAAGAVFTAAAGGGGKTSRVSVSSAGVEGNAVSQGCAISCNGRWVAFGSLASNLTPLDLNGQFDVFVRDQRTGETERVSVDSAGSETDTWSGNPALSPQGRWVSFDSGASSLVPGDTNGYTDVFVHDRKTDETERVSVASSGAEANADSLVSALSANGRWVAFSSFASNLAPADDNGDFDIFVHDRRTRETTRASVASSGEGANGFSAGPAISSNGRWVAFQSFASNLVPGDTNGLTDIFVHDRETGETSRVSVDSSGIEGNASSLDPALSPNGRWVAFQSFADNLVPGDGPQSDIFLHDRKTGETSLVSVDSSGGAANNSSSDATLSSSARNVAFFSMASNLVRGDTNGEVDVFVHDRRTGVTTRESVASSGLQANEGSFTPVLSAGGRRLAFSSLADNLVPADTNASEDVFVRDLR